MAKAAVSDPFLDDLVGGDAEETPVKAKKAAKAAKPAKVKVEKVAKVKAEKPEKVGKAVKTPKPKLAKAPKAEKKERKPREAGVPRINRDERYRATELGLANAKDGGPHQFLLKEFGTTKKGTPVGEAIAAMVAGYKPQRRGQKCDETYASGYVTGLRRREWIERVG